MVGNGVEGEGSVRVNWRRGGKGWAVGGIGGDGVRGVEGEGVVEGEGGGVG